MAKIKNYSTEKYIELNKNVKAYICGPTVYDSIHIGNLRPILIFDIFAKSLKVKNIDTIVVHNITDIDDKIIEKSIEENISEEEIFKKYTNEYFDVLKKMNIGSITNFPKVTENIELMINVIKELIKKDYAYEKNGSVYFRVKKINNYGKDHKVLNSEFLSSKNEDKENHHDFSLWKNDLRGLNFNSPWGKGRPGWHTECVAFIDNIFNSETIDIHGGGIDLRFPHHTNEEAQFMALKNKKLSRSYFYVGHVKMNDEKMSKSKKNVIYVKDFLKDYSENVLRYGLISTTYTKPINFNKNYIETILLEIKKIKNVLTNSLDLILKKYSFNDLTDEKNHFYDEVLKSVLENINTSNAIFNINEMIKFLNKKNVNNDFLITFNSFVESLKLLGFSIEINISKKIFSEYKNFHQNKDFKKIDELRKNLVLF